MVNFLAIAVGANAWCCESSSRRCRIPASIVFVVMDSGKPGDALMYRRMLLDEVFYRNGYITLAILFAIVDRLSP
jgi:hypothetical protein